MVARLAVRDRSSDDLAACFSAQGVVLIERVVDDLEALREAVSRYIAEIAPIVPEGRLRYEPDGKSFRSMYDMNCFDSFFEELGERQSLKELVERVTGWKPVFVYAECFNKPAHVGTEVTKHQELAFIPVEPPDMVHLWIALDEATEDNGAINYWLGTHKYGLLPHRQRAPHGGQLTLGDELVNAYGAERVRAVLPAGGGAIHHGLIIHGSPPNATPHERRGLVLAYRGAHTRRLPPHPTLHSPEGGG